ncbi:MAG: type VI secretion system baseplate subunit TssG [Alcanivorax sp.]|nr:type VI secretion system baseplate subunit TssG [Alcanivorax sp.]
MGATGGVRGADLMQALLSAPYQFDFVQAMELLESSDPLRQRFGQGLDRRVRLLPSDNLVFPATDVRDCQQQEQTLTLMMGFLGLYGIDAPVPHYLLDRTTAEDDDAARMRAFLDVFNQRFYVLIYRAMQISRPAAGMLPEAFIGCASALAGQPRTTPGCRRFPAGRVRTASGLQALLRDAFPDLALEVRDCQPVWQALGHGSELGAESFCLGDNSILGGRAYMANGAVVIRLGPMDEQQAQALLPGQADNQRIRQLIGDYLHNQVGSELQLRVTPSGRFGRALGRDPIHLGWSLWLGEQLQDEYLIRVKNH